MCDAMVQTVCMLATERTWGMAKLPESRKAVTRLGGETTQVTQQEFLPRREWDLDGT